MAARSAVSLLADLEAFQEEEGITEEQTIAQVKAALEQRIIDEQKERLLKSRQRSKLKSQMKKSDADGE